MRQCVVFVLSSPVDVTQYSGFVSSLLLILIFWLLMDPAITPFQSAGGFNRALPASSHVGAVGKSLSPYVLSPETWLQSGEAWPANSGVIFSFD